MTSSSDGKGVRYLGTTGPVKLCSKKKCKDCAALHYTIEKLEKEIDESQIKKGTKRKAKRAKIERS